MASRIPRKLLPYEKAHATGRWAEIIFRALSARVADRWKFVSFRGTGQGEWRGIVDVLAIRKNTVQPRNTSLKRGDLFDIVLVQMKGGTVTRFPLAAFYKITDVARFAADYLEPLLSGGVSDNNSYSHLMSLGCVQIGPAPSDISVFFMTHWRTLFSRGIPKADVERLQQTFPDARVREMFVPFDGSPDLFRLAPQNNEGIEQLARSIGLSDAVRGEIFQLDAGYLLKGHDLFEFLKALHPATALLWATWTGPNAPLPRAQLTTLGLTLAHAYLATLGKAPLPLSLWISPLQQS